MTPIELTATINSHNGSLQRSVVLHRPLTVLLGPNGSGKTHLLRALKASLGSHAAGKKVRFLSSGRLGMLEQWRSDYDGVRGGNPDYESATFGGKKVQARRHQIETIVGDFQTLAERADILLKIQERLRKLFRRDVLIDWDSGNLKVSFARTDEVSQPYSSGREASGLMHLVGILAALYDDEVGALLVDEPEVSLHPQLQAFLLKEMLSVAGLPDEQGGNKKLLVIATHSTEMIQLTKTEDLLSLVFCHDLRSDPIQIPSDAGELRNRKLQGLVSRLGQEHKLALFSKRPLLVEGPSDLLVCSALAGRTDQHLEAAGSQILPVVGKGQMPIVLKLFRLLGKDPVVLADADAIADGLDLVGQFFANSPRADERAQVLGFSTAMEMARAIYRDFCELVEASFGAIEHRATEHPYWQDMSSSDESLRKKRSAFCVIFEVNESDLSEPWVGMRRRLSSLLDLLELCGCFILRRGSIEAYYQVADRLTSAEKPSAAADEAEAIAYLPVEQVRSEYSDIVRCIECAASTQPISESRALRDLLLSVVAPALAKVQEGEETAGVRLMSQRLLGDRSGIFELDVAEGVLTVSLRSRILNFPGLPLSLRPGDDFLRLINDAIGAC